jgi:hypothetical protein
MSVGVSDRFVQRGLQGRIIVIICETGIDAELEDTQFIGRQFVHRGEDLLHGAHDRRLQNKWSRSNMSIRRLVYRFRSFRAALRANGRVHLYHDHTVA